MIQMTTCILSISYFQQEISVKLTNIIRIDSDTTEEKKLPCSVNFRSSSIGRTFLSGSHLSLYISLEEMRLNMSIIINTLE